MDPMIRARLTRWLLAPSLTGRLALLFGIFILVVPTIVRADVDDVVTGCEFTPYLPFVLLAPLLLRWWNAAAVALASVAILGTLFIGPPNHLLASPCFL